jgi:hypothetical protein
MANTDLFTYAYLKQVMKIADEDDALYALALRSVFDHLNTYHTIDVENATDVPYELQLAIFRHTKYLVELIRSNTDVIASSTDSKGDKVTYNAAPPKPILWTYKAYSDEPPAYL